MSGEVVTLTVPAKSEYLILTRLALAGISRAVPMSESVLLDLKLAVTEACGNAVRHAYDDEPGLVRLRFEVDTSSIAVTIEDDGGANGRAEAKQEWLDPDGLAEAGMGLAIIEAVVDSVDVQESADGGTVVRIVKRLRTDPVGGQPPSAASSDG
jgi:serine/threonine-protein kinase RsbW